MARATDVLRVARAQVGVREHPPGSNRVKYARWYGLDGQPWCMMFVQWCFEQAGAASLLPVRTASCGALMRAAQQSGQWVSGDYRPGDVVIYDFPGGGHTDHTGLVEAVSGKLLTVIEGNTGSHSDANGGQVMRRQRRLSLILGAVRPRYEEEAPMAKDNTPNSWAKQAVDWALAQGLVQGDGQGDLALSRPVTLERLLVILHRLEHPAD